MQDLMTNVTGGYTYAQLLERLTADGAVCSCRFDILDPSLNKTKGLGDVLAFDAVVEYDTSREVIGSLGLSMLPNETINLPLFYRIKPWFRVQMLDGGYAEWPQGVYLWNKPTRNNLGRPDEYWELTLGDQCQILQLAGPGATGHTLASGSVITDAIVQIVGALGLDTSGVVASPATMTSDLHWGVYGSRRVTNAAVAAYEAKYHQYLEDERKWKQSVAALQHFGSPGQSIYLLKGNGSAVARERGTSYFMKKPKRPVKPTHVVPFAGEPGTSWLTILTQLHARLGYFPPFFDLTGRYRAIPQPDLPTALPAKQYIDGANGLMVTPGQSTEDLSSICNRVFAQGQSAAGYFDIGTADLNTLQPGHPLSQAIIGFYIDVVVQDQVSTTQEQLLATATTELNRRIGSLRQYNVNTLPWPVHEAFDIVGLTLTTDAEIAAGVTCLETTWSLDLIGAIMTHVWQQVSA